MVKIGATEPPFSLGADVRSDFNVRLFCFSERLMTLYQSSALTVLEMSDAAFLLFDNLNTVVEPCLLLHSVKHVQRAFCFSNYHIIKHEL